MKDSITNLKISLIICAYNEEKYIGECLDYAIKNSKGKFHEIIVIDNASSDKTREIALNYPGVKVVHEPKKGLTSARQKGFEVATGDIIAYIDADTHMPQLWVDMIFEEFSNNDNIVCLSGPYIYYDIPVHNRIWTKMYYWILGMPTYWITGYMVTGGNFAIRKDTLHKMSGFDTSISFYGEDTDIARRAYKHGKVKFKLNFFMYTSGRRLHAHGTWKTAFIYVLNYASEVLVKKPFTKDYTDIR